MRQAQIFQSSVYPGLWIILRWAPLCEAPPEYTNSVQNALMVADLWLDHGMLA